MRRLAMLLMLTACSGSLAEAQSLSDAEGRKQALKCQKAIFAAATRLFTKDLSILGTCSSKALACVHNPKPDKRAACLATTEADNSCGEKLRTIIAAQDTEFGGKIDDACAELLPDELLRPEGLGFELLAADCLSIADDLIDLNAIKSCLRRVYRRSLERLFAVAAPRTREAFDATGVNVSSLPDLPGYPGCQGCSVPAAPEEEKELKKNVVACSNAITKAGKAYATITARVVGKCVLTLFACEQKPKPLSTAKLTTCRAKAGEKCAAAKAKADAAQVKVEATVKEKCAPLPHEDLFGPQGVNLGTLACECNAVNVESVDTLEHYLDCSRLHHECRVAQLLKFAVPRLDGLLARTADTPTLSTILCDIGANPPESSTSERATGCRICRFLRAIRARFNRPMFGPLFKNAVRVPRPSTSALRRREGVRAAAPAVITDVSGSNRYAPDQTRTITVSYQLTPGALAAARGGEPPKLQIAVARLDGSLVADDVFELALEPSVNQTAMAVSYPPDVPGESGCTFQLVFGFADDDIEDFTPFDLDAVGVCTRNGILEPGEECDDGNAVNGDTCDNNCTKPVCGNKIVDAGESCDDGNVEAGDGCPPGCGIEGTPTPTTPTPTLPGATATRTPTPTLTPTVVATTTPNNTSTAPIPTPTATTAGLIAEVIDATGGSGDTLSGPSALAVDGLHHLYVAGKNSNNVFKVAAGGGIHAIIGPSGDGAGNGLNSPVGVAADGSGNVYVAGHDSDNVFKIEPGGTITEIIDASGDGAGNNLAGPAGLAVDGDGNVYVVGQSSDNAFKITPAGVVTQIIDSSGDGTNNLSIPVGIAVDLSGTAYVTGRFSKNVFAIRTIGPITQIINEDGDLGINPLAAPVAVAVNESGSAVYVAGQGSNNVFEIGSGTIREIIDDDGDGPAGHPLAFPVGLAVMGINVYVVGQNSDNVFRTGFGGPTGQLIDATGDGTGNILNQPSAIAVDPDLGRLYVAGEASNNVFRIILP